MGAQHDGATWGFVTAARFHADVAIFHDVQSTHAVFAAEAIKFGERLRRRHLFTVDRDDVALLVFEFDVFRFRRRFFRRHGDAPHRIFRLEIRVFEHAAFVGNVQQVRIHRIRRAAAFFLFVIDSDAGFLGVFQ